MELLEVHTGLNLRFACVLLIIDYQIVADIA